MSTISDGLARNDQTQMEVLSSKPTTLSPLSYLFLKYEPKVLVLQPIMQSVRNATDAILLSQIVYWLKPSATQPNQIRASAYRTGNSLGLLMTHARLSRETGLSIDQVKRSLSQLARTGVIRKAHDYSKGVRRIAIDLTPEGMRYLVAGSRGILVYAGTVRLSGSPNAALVLSQIMYWHRSGRDGTMRLQAIHNRAYWLAKRYQELGEECGLSERQARTAISALKSLRLIDTTVAIYAGVRTLHVKCRIPEFIAAWQSQSDAWICESD